MIPSEIVTVTVREEAEGPVSINFEFCTGEAVPLLLPDRRPLDSAARNARAYLDALRRKVPGLSPSESDLRDGLAILFGGGVQLSLLLAAQDTELLYELSSAFRRARNSLSRDRIPLVQLIAHDTSIPIELLPLFDLADLPSRVENPQELQTVAERFVGFSAIVRRIPPATTVSEDSIDNTDGLAVQLLRWRAKPRSRRRVTGFDAEPNFLRSLSPEVSVDGPWPISGLTDEQVQSRLIDVLYDPDLPLESASDPSTLTHIQHFVCHCDTQGRDDEFVLRLSTEKGREHHIRLDDIRKGYVTRLARDAGVAPHERRATLIVNACGSSAADPVSALSLPAFFLSNRHPAFVGTQAVIPDVVAAAYAEELYRFMLCGASLGEALLRARRRLLVRSHCLLGLLYVLFGNEQLSLTRIEAGAASYPGSW